MKMRELAKKLAMEDALRKLSQHRLGSWERDVHHRWYWQDRKAFKEVRLWCPLRVRARPEAPHRVPTQHTSFPL